MSDDDSPAAPPTARRKKKAARRWSLVGPLFRWELVRLARRGQDARARFILAVSLLAVLTVFTLIWFPSSDPWDLFFGTSQLLSLKQSSSFGASFAVTFILAQLAVMMLLTPAYAAGGISEEKERKTLPYLLVSDLTSWEIVTGKALGRLVFLLGVMMAGLPVLALTQFYGGVSIEYVIAAYFLTATTVTMHAMIAAAAACGCETFRGALFRGYGFAGLHAFVGFGHPLLSPLVVVSSLYWIQAESVSWFWISTVLYGGVELLFALGAFLLAVRWTSKLRAKPLSQGEKRVIKRRERRDRDDLDDAAARRRRRERARRQDLDEEYHEGRRRREEALQNPPPAPIILNDPPVEETLALTDEITPSSEGNFAVARPLPVAASVRNLPPPPAPPSRRSDDRDRPPKKRRPAPAARVNRPTVDGGDPFLWKETHILGVKRTADDDSIRGVLIAVGICVGLFIGFFVLIAMTAVLASEGNRGAVRFAESTFVLCGSMGYFLYLLVVGSAASSSVVRERQQMTLESLLTIPVDRRAILFPKWWVSVRRAWWWGAFATLTIPVGFLFSDTPIASGPVLGFVAFGVVMIASYGLWLSIRCRTASRAVLWMLPGITFLTFAPILVWSWTDRDTHFLSVGLFAALTLFVAALAFAFWHLSFRAFEAEGRT